MTALEAIYAELKTLPADKLEKAAEYIHKLVDGSSQTVTYADRKSFEASAEKVFNKHSKLFEKLAQ